MEKTATNVCSDPDCEVAKLNLGLEGEQDLASKNMLRDREREREREILPWSAATVGIEGGGGGEPGR